MPKLNLDNEYNFVISEANRRQSQKRDIFGHKLLLIIKTLLCEIINERNKAKKQVREGIYLKTKNFYLTSYS